MGVLQLNLLAFSIYFMIGVAVWFSMKEKILKEIEEEWDADSLDLLYDHMALIDFIVSMLVPIIICRCIKRRFCKK